VRSRGRTNAHVPKGCSCVVLIFTVRRSSDFASWLYHRGLSRRLNSAMLFSENMVRHSFFAQFCVICAGLNNSRCGIGLRKAQR
jgi:hypothetical protein